MNKRYPALVIVAVVLVSTVLAVIFLQSTTQNSTLIADSFELQIKDMIPLNSNYLNFVRYDNKTLIDQFSKL